jgi:hypothetical protein
MSYPQQIQNRAQQNGNKSDAPRIPQGRYIGRIDDPTIVADKTKSDKVQLKFRVDLHKRGADGKLGEHVGGLIQFCGMSSAEALRITCENIEAFIEKPSRDKLRTEMRELLLGKRTTITGFGTSTANVSVKHETWEGKVRPRMSIFAGGVKAQNAPDASTAARAASEIDALFAVMGEKTSAASGASGVGLDLGDGDADNTDDSGLPQPQEDEPFFPDA